MFFEFFIKSVFPALAIVRQAVRDREAVSRVSGVLGTEARIVSVA